MTLLDIDKVVLTHTPCRDGEYIFESFDSRRGPINPCYFSHSHLVLHNAPTMTATNSPPNPSKRDVEDASEASPSKRTVKEAKEKEEGQEGEETTAQDENDEEPPITLYKSTRLKGK